MPRVYQAFILNEPSTQIGNERDKVEEFSIGGRFLKNGLVDRGYEVLASNEEYSGVPKSIIVGGDLEAMRDVKEVFYALANGLKLSFESGYFYHVLSE